MLYLPYFAHRAHTNHTGNNSHAQAGRHILFSILHVLILSTGKKCSVWPLVVEMLIRYISREGYENSLIIVKPWKSTYTYICAMLWKYSRACVLEIFAEIHG